MSNTALRDALSSAKERYAARNPSSRAQWHSAVRAMPGGNTRTILYFDPFPLCIVRGEECYLFDADGHRYVDLLGEYTAGIFEHSNAIIRTAVIDALNGVDRAVLGDRRTYAPFWPRSAIYSKSAPGFSSVIRTRMKPQ